MTPAQQRKAVRLYTEGRTAYEIANAFGVHESTVRHALESAGVQRRRTGQRGRVDVATDQILELRDVHQLSWQQVADELGMSKTGVQKRYRAASR